LKEVDIDEISSRGKFNVHAAKWLGEFQQKDAKAVLVEINVANKKEFESLYNAFKHIIKQEKLPVDVVQRKGEIYLIKK